MKHFFVLYSLIVFFTIVYLCVLPSEIRAGDNQDTKIVKMRFVPGDATYLPAFKKKIKFIDVSFSVVINGTYEKHFVEMNQTDTEERQETVMGGGETNHSVLTKQGLPDCKLSCSGNTFTLNYSTKDTYISSAGTYFLVGEVSPDGKVMKSLTIKFAGGTGSENWSYNLIASGLPWAGSLGPNFDKFKRNYNFKYGEEGKAINSFEYVKTSGNDSWKYKLTAKEIARDKNQSLEVYFTFE